MFDMGGEYACYGADISRSYPVSGPFCFLFVDG